MKMRVMKSSFAAIIYAIIIGFCRGCLEEERTALLQIKESINSPEGSAFSSWYGQDCCQWEAVECSPSTSRVLKLFLYDRRDPNLPDEWYPNVTLFAQLKGLQELHLQRNGIGGFVSPTALHELKHLQRLELRGNSIKEGSHLCWGKMPSLHILGLSSNTLQGHIPKCLCEMHSVTKLDLSNNKLHGDIDACFSNMNFLKHLDISGNLFNGSFPSLLLRNITNIETFIASQNKFREKISFSMFANLSKLSYLDLSDIDNLEVETESPAWSPSFNLRGLFLGGCNLNKHSGNTIPSFISTQYHLLSLDLSENSLVGSIPSWLLYNLTSKLWLRGNMLSGSFPQPNGNMSFNLVVLDISDNLLRGPMPSNLNIILPYINSLDLSRNQFHGEIPVLSMAENGTSSLEYLDLSNNRFLQGKILPRNSSFPKLKWLYLSGNNFTEINSHSLSTCSSSLQVLDLAENRLSGELSSQLPLLTGLKVISLRRNHFEGRIPAEHLCQMQGLHLLDIAENNFSDTIPSCLNNISSWTEHPSFGNLKVGYISRAHASFVITKGMAISLVKVPSFYTHLDVSSNQLTGTIPFVMGDLKNMRILNVSNNLLTGHIPTTLGSLGQLESLDLSHNKLFGQIPNELVALEFLEVFLAAFNNLSGPTPLGKQFDTFSNDSYIGNPGLCGHPLVKECSSSSSNNVPESAATAAAAPHTEGARKVSGLLLLTAYIFIMGGWTTGPNTLQLLVFGL